MSEGSIGSAWAFSSAIVIFVGVCPVFPDPVFAVGSGFMRQIVDKHDLR